jgi:hypothetical protein
MSVSLACGLQPVNPPCPTVKSGPVQAHPERSRADNRLRELLEGQPRVSDVAIARLMLVLVPVYLASPGGTKTTRHRRRPMGVGTMSGQASAFSRRVLRVQRRRDGSGGCRIARAISCRTASPGREHTRTSVCQSSSRRARGKPVRGESESGATIRRDGEACRSAGHGPLGVRLAFATFSRTLRGDFPRGPAGCRWSLSASCRRSPPT